MQYTSIFVHRSFVLQYSLIICIHRRITGILKILFRVEQLFFKKNSAIYYTECKGRSWCYKQYLKDAMWRRAGNDDMIGYAKVVSVSTSCSRYSILTFFSYIITRLSYGLQLDSSCIVHIYSIDNILYPHTLLLL